MVPRPKARLDDIVESALRIFSEKGYRRTLISDVARDLGIAPGTIYTYVESKEALFDLVVQRAAGETTPPPVLPVPTPAPGETARYTTRALARSTAHPTLDRALAARKVEDALGELEGIVRELFAIIARSRRLLALVERSAIDLPDMHEHFYVKGRRPFVRDLAAYLDARSRKGQLRAVPDSAVTARYILEMISWFANHRHGDRDSVFIDDEAAETVCVDMIVHGLRP
jgi:AcrR family transcriptional regulator